MMELLQQRDPSVPLRTACHALGLARSTAYRRLHPRPRARRKERKPSLRRLTDAERQRVLDALHCERFADQPPREVYAQLLSEGVYLASVRTMYRVLVERSEIRERRNQRPPRRVPTPSLSATAPNQVWTWTSPSYPRLRRASSSICTSSSTCGAGMSLHG